MGDVIGAVVTFLVLSGIAYMFGALALRWLDR